jgi:NADPH-ferrihemoprotein reductase
MDLFDDTTLYILIPLILFGVYYFFLKPKPAPKVAPQITPINRRKKKEEEDNATGVKVKILYASQTGTAEEFSHKLSQEAKRFGFAPKVVDIEDLDRDELPQESFIIILAATYGEGEPTDNSREFYDWIIDEGLEKDLLKNVQYTVFGLGNKTYEHYNAMGRIFDRRLEEIGAKRIFKKGEGDEDASLEDDFAAWKKELWPALVQHFNIQVDLNQKQDETARRFKVKHYEDTAIVAKNAKMNIHKHLCKKDVRTVDYDMKNPYIAKVIENRELHSSGSDRSCRHVEIDIDKALKYEPGDHLGIYPENDPKIVEEIAND